MESFIYGIVLVVIAGICWIGIGVTVSLCSARGWNYNIVQGASYLGSALFSGILLLAQKGSAGLEGVISTGCLLSFLAGFSNFYTYFFTSRAMKCGPNGLVWGIMQSGLIGSFLMGVIVFGEEASLLRLSGLFLILGGVLCMGLARNNTIAGSGKYWLFYSLLAMFLVMLTNSCNSLPSYLPASAGTSSIVRTLGLYAGGASGFLITTFPPMIRKRNFGGRPEWIVAALLMLLNTSASMLFFFHGLDLLAKNGSGGLSYPIAIGVCVVGFSLYSIFFLKEKIARTGLAGLGAVSLGIIIIALR